ncbi:MAG: hypothetical protein ACLTYN_13735 [Dysosmobacter welbionis]
MKEGEARAIKSGTSYYFLYKGKIGDHLDELSTESGRMSVLAAMKQDEFQERMERKPPNTVHHERRGGKQLSARPVRQLTADGSWRR